MKETGESYCNHWTELLIQGPEYVLFHEYTIFILVLLQLLLLKSNLRMIPPPQKKIKHHFINL